MSGIAASRPRCGDTGAERPCHGRGWCAFEWKVALLSSFLVFDRGKPSEEGREERGEAGSGEGDPGLDEGAGL